MSALAMPEQKINAIAGAEFYEDLIETRNASGAICTVPVDMIRIYWGGDTKRELHAPASDRSDRYELLADRSKVWLKWSDAFPHEWKAYKERRERRSSGTPLHHLSTILTKARVQELERNNIFTAEQLVAIEPGIISKMGFDARALQNQVKDFLARVAGVDNDVKLRAEMDAQAREMALLRDQIAALQAGSGREPAPATKKAAPADDISSDPAFATFNAMDDDELRARITEGEGKPPHNRCGHDTLVRMAVEMNNRLAAAA